MSIQLFEEKEHAAVYQKFRFEPSQEVIDIILGFLDERLLRPRGFAVDVGCGTGQNTRVLSPHFKKVLGIDLSNAQIEEAKNAPGSPNVTYRACPAEEVPVADASVDLLTACAAVHWFNTDKFLKEVDRILKPRGCLAFFSYTPTMEIHYRDHWEEMTQVYSEVDNILARYQHEKVLQVRNGYKEIFDAIPYTDKRSIERFVTKIQIPLSRLLGFIQTTAMFQTYLRTESEKAKKMIRTAEQSLLRIALRLQLTALNLLLTALKFLLTAPSLLLTAPSLLLTAPSLLLIALRLQLTALNLLLTALKFLLTALSLLLTALGLLLIAPSLLLTAPSLLLTAPSLLLIALRLQLTALNLLLTALKFLLTALNLLLTALKFLLTALNLLLTALKFLLTALNLLLTALKFLLTALNLLLTALKFLLTALNLLLTALKFLLTALSLLLSALGLLLIAPSLLLTASSLLLTAPGLLLTAPGLPGIVNNHGPVIMTSSSDTEIEVWLQYVLVLASKPQ
ncbi:uncharacterized protein ACMZJ9_009942 [Mantella aurantiaca]